MLSLVRATSAQVSFEISPYAGLSVPLRSMFVQNIPVQVPYDQYGTGATVALKKTIAVGGHLTVWAVRRFGIETTLGYAPFAGSSIRAGDSNFSTPSSSP